MKIEVDEIVCDARQLIGSKGVEHCSFKDGMRIIAQYVVTHDTFLVRWDTIIDGYKCTVKKWMPDDAGMGVEIWIRMETPKTKILLKELYLHRTEMTTEICKI